MGREREEYAIVLDFLPEGHPRDTRPSHRKDPIAQAIGKTNFSLLELVPRDGVYLNIGDEVYIGEGKREQIHHIEGRISLDRLTNTAEGELDHVIEALVEEREDEFVDFFNNAPPLSTRMHSLQLLPGVGKKHMWEVLEERKAGDFESFAQVKDRVKLLPDPKKLIVRRIKKELTGDEKHRLFAK